MGARGAALSARSGTGGVRGAPEFPLADGIDHGSRPAEREPIRPRGQMLQQSPVRVEHFRAPAEPPLAVRQQYDDAARGRDEVGAFDPHLSNLAG